MEGEVRVWEMRSREMISHLKEHINRVTKVKVTLKLKLIFYDHAI